MKVMFRFYDKNLFEQGLAKSLNSAIENGITSGYSLNKDDCKELQAIIGVYKGREYKQTVILDKF
jgi:hypothetical protein